MSKPTYQTPLIHRLSAFRSSLGITREDAAARAVINPRTWAAWELGETTPETPNWTLVSKGLDFASFDAFWQAYCRYCCEHPETTSVGFRPPPVEPGNGEVAQEPKVYQAAPCLHEMLSPLLLLDLDKVFLAEWYQELRRQRSNLLKKAGQLDEDILAFQWLYDKARKKASD